jgi:hypothetical protein
MIIPAALPSVPAPWPSSQGTWRSDTAPPGQQLYWTPRAAGGTLPARAYGPTLVMSDCLNGNRHGIVATMHTGFAADVGRINR